MLELIAFTLVILLAGRGYTTRRLNKVNKALEETCVENDSRIKALSICTATLIQDVDGLSTRIEDIEIKINTPPPLPPED
jgi:hypothetical protein